MSICLRYSKSREDAIEIANDGFYKVMTNLDKYSPELSFKGWIRRIIINTAIDQYRRDEKHYNHLDISYVSEQLDPTIFGDLSADDILKAVQLLPVSYRMVFNLFAIEGFKHEEIAAKLGISVGTSKSNLNAARVKLMKVLSIDYERNLKQNGG